MLFYVSKNIDPSCIWIAKLWSSTFMIYQHWPSSWVFFVNFHVCDDVNHDDANCADDCFKAFSWNLEQNPLKIWLMESSLVGCPYLTSSYISLWPLIDKSFFYKQGKDFRLIQISEASATRPSSNIPSLVMIIIIDRGMRNKDLN